jgi:hypothetical protein
MYCFAATLLAWRYRLAVVGLSLFVFFALSTSLALAMEQGDDGADPLPQGCIRPTPPGEEPPLCCLSGFVYELEQAVEGAEIRISDARGEIGKVYTQRHKGTESKPYYYVDLTKLQLRSPIGTRPITPTDVITLVASYNGISTPPLVHTVREGGQNENFNLFDQGARVLNGQNLGVADPGQFQSISEGAADSWGNLYLWDVRNVRMQVLSPDGQWLNRPNWQRETGHPADQVITIHSVAIARKNNNNRVYLADPYNARIAVYTTDGDFTGKTIPIQGFVSSIGIDGDGNLYAYTYYQGLKKYNAAGQFITQTTDAILTYDTSVRQIAVSPQGDVFFVKVMPNGIFKFNQDLQPVPFDLARTSGVTLTRPTAMTVDDANTLYIYDHATFKLYAFDANGTLLNRSWPSPPFSQGSEVSLSHAGDYIYLISSYDGSVLQLPKGGGEPLKMVGGRTDNPQSIGMPVDIAIAPDNSLFFADTWTARIGRQVDNQVVQSWTLQELGYPTRTLPTALTFDRNGKLLMLTNQHTIQRWRYEDTRLITETVPWGARGTELGKFCSPSGLDTDKDGFIFVSDYCNHRVQVLREDPVTNGFVAITSLSTLTATGVLSMPLGIAVDDRTVSTMLYVVDEAYNHIVKLQFDGATLTFAGIIGSFGYNPGQLVTPHHLDVAEDGSLWVADNYYRVHHINPEQPTEWRIYGEYLTPAWNSYGIAITKTVDHKDLLYVSSTGFGLISSFTPMEESAPVATIVHCSERDLVPGQELICIGSGQDGDGSNTITRYELTTESGLHLRSDNAQIRIPTVAGATQPGQLGSGLHTLRLRVRGDEGNEQDDTNDWSQPVSTTIFVDWRVPEPGDPIPTRDPVQPPPDPPATCTVGGVWTMLLYLDADNRRDGTELLADYRTSLAALKQLNHPCVQVAVQLDGPGNSDTVRWLIRPNPTGLTPIVTPGEFGATITTTEIAMDHPDALSNFITWGQNTLPADHYYLAISNHGNAYQGIAFDETSGANWSAYLEASELQTALTAPGVLPIDILHLDACSMALLDVAYEVRGKVKYLIASQYIGWGFFAYADYARYITPRSEPEQLATLIVNRYATWAEAYHLPYTLSALNLTRIEQTKAAVDELAMLLKAWLNVDEQAKGRHKQLFDVRNQSQLFDSNTNFINTPRDAYVDLGDFVERVKQAGLTNDITAAADVVLKELTRSATLDGLILVNRHSSTVKLPPQYGKGAPITIQKASGLSLYYPAEGTALLSLPAAPSMEDVIAASAAYSYTQKYAEYTQNQLFDFTRAARWDEFLVTAYGEPPSDPTQLEPPPAPLAPPAPVNNTNVALQQSYRLEDRDHNGPSAGDALQFETQINNQSEVTLTNVVLVQLLNQPLQQVVSAALYPCTESTLQQLCISVPDIGAKKSAQAPFTVMLSANVPIVTQAILYVDGKPLGEPVTPMAHQSQLYLPVVMKQ